MRNPFTEAEEFEYRQAMHERYLEKQRQLREDALDAIDVSSGQSTDEDDDDE